MLLNVFLIETLGKKGEILAAIGPDPVIDLYRLVPVVKMGSGKAGAIARPLGGIFLEFTIGQRMLLPSQRTVIVFGKRYLETLSRIVVEVVVPAVSDCHIVLGSEIANPCRIVFSLIFPGHMVGHNVYDHF